MGGFFGGLAAGIGGAGSALNEYSQQMRPILEGHRHDFANLISQTIPTVQDPEFKSYLFKLGGDLANNKPLGPLMQDFQTRMQKHQDAEQAYHSVVGPMAPVTGGKATTDTGSGSGIPGGLMLTPSTNLPGTDSGVQSIQRDSLPGEGPLPPKSPATPGQLALLGNADQFPFAGQIGTPSTPPMSAAQTAETAVPTSTNIQAQPTPGGTVVSQQPGITGTSLLDNDQFQYSPLEQSLMDQYKKEQASPWGVSARTEAAVAPIFQRQAQLGQLRATARVDVEKTAALRDQNLQAARNAGIDITKLPPSAALLLATEGKLPPPQLLKPGEYYVDSTGRMIAQGAPRLDVLPEGSQLVETPNPAGTAAAAPAMAPAAPPPTVTPTAAVAPMAPIAAPGSHVVASSAPRLTPEETRATSAALQTAQKYGLPFDASLNPRNPLAQLPPKYQAEASGLAKQMNEDPELRAQRIQMNATQEQIKNLTATLLQTQLGTIPTKSDYALMAKSIVDHTLSPDELRSLRSGGMRGWDPAKVFAETKAIDPKFSWEKAENEYKSMTGTEKNFTSGSAASLVRANNTALEHIGMLDQARDMLKNGNIPALNAIANAIGVQTGSTAKTTFDTIAQAVGKEVNKAYIPGGGGQMERLAEVNDFSSSKGDKQLKENIRATLNLMKSQQESLEDQYKRGTYGQGTQELWSPGAIAARERVMGPMRPVAQPLLQDTPAPVKGAASGWKVVKVE